MNGLSSDLRRQRLESLQSLMPDVFAEGKIDFDRLRQALDPKAFAPPEHYELTWAGKADARREIQRQTTATLTPDRDQSIGFDTTQHVFIEGENLDVLRTLQRAYFGKVKMIYIDPPYNTGNDSFVYPDDYAERLTDYQQRAGLTDAQGYLNKQDLWRTNRRENGQFHSYWMSMMYPRLFLARNLLREDGVIFVSIDDNEMSNLKGMMDEIFGGENVLATLIWKRRQNVDSRTKTGASVDHEYLLCYGKSEYATMQGAEKDLTKYSNPDNDLRGDWMSDNMVGLATKDQRPNLHYDLTDPSTGITYSCPPTGWRYEPKRMKQLMEGGEVLFPAKGTGRPRRKKFVKDLQSDFSGFSTVLNTAFNTQATRELRLLFDDKEYFDFPKPADLLKKIIQQGAPADEESIILDFFAGSATTAQAVLELNAEDGGNRRFVLVQLPEPTDPKTEARKAGFDTIADIGRARVRRVIDRMNAEIVTLQTAIGTIKERLEANEAAIAEYRANMPELFDDANPPKALSQLQARADSLQQSLSTTTEKLTRLQATDKGFRAFRLAPSNMKVWQSEINKSEVAQLLIDYTRSDKEGAESERMLYEFLLKKGYPLTARVDELDLDGIRAYSVEGGQMLVLLDGYNQAINDRIIDTYPRHVVCLDRLFAGNDEALTNLHLDLRDRNIELSVI